MKRMAIATLAALVFTDAVLGMFTNTVEVPGFPVGSVIGFSFAGAFTGSLADGEQWKGTSGAEENLCCNEPSPMFLQMSGPNLLNNLQRGSSI